MHLLFFAKQTTGIKTIKLDAVLQNNVVTVLWSFYRDIIPYFWDSMTWDGFMVQQFSFFNIELYNQCLQNSTTPKFDSSFSRPGVLRYQLPEETGML
jgi:hypothetical protein